MDHDLTAQLAALAGVLGSILVLVARSRDTFIAGLVLVGGAGVGLALALTERSALDRASSPTAIAAGALAALLLVTAAVLLARAPGAIIPLMAATAAFRPPIDFDGSHTFLLTIATDGRLGRLLPLYAVLATATLALVIRVIRGAPVPALPSELAYPAAFLIGLTGTSLLWSRDVPAGAELLLYFTFPFAVMVAIVGRAPFRPWLPRVLFLLTVAVTSLFALVGLWEAHTQRLIFFTPRVEVGNAYESFFRVTSLFSDPSLYGRHVVVGIAVLLVAMWAGKVRFAVAVALIAFLWAGLFFSYSQSSMVALFVTVAAIALVMGGSTARKVVAVVSIAIVLLGGAAVAASVKGDSVGQITSDRSRRASLTVRVFAAHPLTGVGVGGHPRASADLAERIRPVANYVSHSTPLTVAAEFGLVGIAAFLALLAGSIRMLDRVRRDNEALGLGLGAVFLALFVHSLFYGGLFEDPIAWLVLGIGAAALVAPREPATETEPTQSPAPPREAIPSATQ